MPEDEQKKKKNKGKGKGKGRGHGRGLKFRGFKGGRGKRKGAKEVETGRCCSGC